MIAKELKPGMVIQFENGLYRVLTTQIIAPGNWRAFVQAKLRKLSDGTQKENRFRADENVERAFLDYKEVEYLYQEGDMYHFMDTSNYEQFTLSSDDLGNAKLYMLPNTKLQVEFHEGTPIGVTPPKTVKLKITQTEPQLKTATATSSYKPATLETGASVQVPPFISEGDVIEVNTDTGEYVGRA